MTAPALSIARCRDCGALDGAETGVCRDCGSAHLERVPVSGNGRLVSWTVVRRPAGAFADRPPFAVVLVDLDEGVRVTGHLEAFDPEPAIGARLHVRDVHDGVPRFEPVPEPAATC